MELDAVLLVSFGGPEGPEDVRPFLANVLRGRQIPERRLQEIESRYLEFGGVSPINSHNRALADSLRSALADRGRPLPVYWGNRNWHPYLTDALEAMHRDGIRRAAAFVTSAYSSYSSCRQYIEELDAARRATGPGAPEVLKLRPYFDHPGFVDPLADGLKAAIGNAGPGAAVLMSAHSIPGSMAAACDYELQLRHVAALLAARARLEPDSWQMVFQSRSGPPDHPWLGPDIGDAIASLPPGTEAVVVVPIGFVSDHMEVVYDLDRIAAEAAAKQGMRFLRTATPERDPRFVKMIVDLLDEVESGATPAALSSIGPAPFPCPPGCCPRGPG